jgi:hypothetical protein
MGKNPKLTPKWQGPAKVTEVNDTNARLLLPNGKTKIYNIMRLKKFFLPLLQTLAIKTLKTVNSISTVNLKSRGLSLTQ